jgi:hypothetical protein
MYFDPSNPSPVGYDGGMLAMSDSVTLIDIVCAHAYVLAYLSFAWLPLAFAAYAIGKRQVGLRFFFILAALEGAAIALAVCLQEGTTFIFWEFRLIESRAMKFQFSISAILLATAFVGICLAGMLPFWRELTPSDKVLIPRFLLTMGPILIPFLFTACAMGRKALTRWIILAFATTEAAAVFVFWSLIWGRSAFFLTRRQTGPLPNGPNAHAE